MGQNENRIEREMDLINQMTDDSMVDTEIEDIIKDRACIEHEEGKLQILTNLIKDRILTIQGAAKRMNMTEEVFRSKMR